MKYGKSVKQRWYCHSCRSLFYTALALAAILSLSVFAIAYAKEGQVGTSLHVSDRGVLPKKVKGQVETNTHLPDYSKCNAGSSCAPQRVDDNNSNGENKVVHDLKNVFRSSGNHHDNNAPPALVTPLDANTTALFNETGLAICDGVVPGPCFDTASHTIIP